MNSDKLLKDYKKNGFIIIKNFFSKKIINKAKYNILKEAKKNSNELFFYEKNKKKLRRIENIAAFSNDANKIINNFKLNKLVNKILGKNILFKDKLNFKYPGGGGFSPHIDGHFFWKDKNNNLKKGWKQYSNKFLSVVIPLEVSNIKNGCLQIANLEDTKKNFGTNWNNIVKKIYKFTPKVKKNYIKKFKFIPIELNAGDILLFDWKVCHGSKKNNSKNSRMIFYVTFAKIDKFKNLKEKYYNDKISSKNTLSSKSLN